VQSSHVPSRTMVLHRSRGLSAKGQDATLTGPFDQPIGRQRSAAAAYLLATIRTPPSLRC